MAGILGAAVAGLLVWQPLLAQARPAHAPRARANEPRLLGNFEDWKAATHAEGGQTVCYAFTRAQSSAPNLSGRHETDVVLTVTERPAGRDAVAISAGFAYPAGAEVVLAVDKTELPFYTSGRSAFARDGHAVAMAFDHARSAVAKSPGPRGVAVSDTFSLRGFAAAYAAINKTCPAK